MPRRITNFGNGALAANPLLMEGTMSSSTCVRTTLLPITALFILAISTGASAQGKIPEFASSTFAWLSAGAEWRDPPAGYRGPIKNDPNHPYHGNLDGP